MKRPAGPCFAEDRSARCVCRQECSDAGEQVHRQPSARRPRRLRRPAPHGPLAGALGIPPESATPTPPTRAESMAASAPNPTSDRLPERSAYSRWPGSRQSRSRRCWLPTAEAPGEGLGSGGHLAVSLTFALDGGHDPLLWSIDFRSSASTARADSTVLRSRCSRSAVARSAPPRHRLHRRMLQGQAVCAATGSCRRAG